MASVVDANRNKIHLLSKHLQELNYPFLEVKEDWWFHDLFLTPGEERVQLFLWLFKTLDYENIPTRQFSLEDDYQAVFNFVSSLGFCGPNDKALIEGTGSAMAQLNLWTMLIDIAVMYVKMIPDVTASVETKRAILDEKFNEGMKHIVNMHNLFITEDKSYLPADIKRSIKNTVINDSHKSMLAEFRGSYQLPEASEDSVSVSPSSKISKNEMPYCGITNTSSGLVDLSEVDVASSEMATAKDKQEEERLNASEVMHSKVLESLKDFSKAAGKLSCCYNELKMDENAGPSERSGMGPEFVEASGYQNQFSEYIEQCATTRASLKVLDEEKKRAESFEWPSSIMIPADVLEDFAKLLLEERNEEFYEKIRLNEF